jgi:trans-2,3-dihydro-3-hydroxyanthranilate isomerase
MLVGFHLLDVFADEPFAGNQLCVVIDPPRQLDADTMLTLTREIGFSETTFVTGARPDGYDVRIFTPDAEIPFAGHPTLGTAFALAADGRVSSSVVQTSAAGDVPVEIDLAANLATMRQLPPVFGPEVTDRDAVASAAGLEADDLVADWPVQTGSTGMAHLMVPVREEAALRRAERSDRGCAELCAATHAESLYLFTVRGDGDVMARMFDRGAAIGEDPATGSAAGPLSAYLAKHGLAGMPGSVTVAQGEIVRRPSFLRAQAEPNEDSWSIRVGGGVRIVGEGSFRL